MRERVTAIDDLDDAPASGWRLLAWMRAHPSDTLALTVLVAGIVAILINAMALQSGPHPAPIFAHKPVPLPVETVMPRARKQDAVTPATSQPVQTARPRADLIVALQRELLKRGFYDGAFDGAYNARTDSAIRDFEQAAGLRASAEPNEALLATIARSPVKAAATPAATAKKDPIAALLGPDKRVVALQRALSEYGYGQMRPDGAYGPEMRSAIERFERERRMPITGRVSDKLVKELSAITGRPLD